MKIASLFPAGSEIICNLGLSKSLIAVSHECDFPPLLSKKTKVTKSIIPKCNDQNIIDQLVKDAIKNNVSLYQIDNNRLLKMNPDLIITQGLCEVCSISENQIQATLKNNLCTLSNKTKIMSLNATTFDEICEEIIMIGKEVNKVKAAEKITGLRLGPDDAYLITRGLRTLDVRLDRHRENAKKIAAFLSKNKKIKLLYPYKKDSLNFRMWKKYYSGASGLMGLKIKAKNINSVRKFVNSLKLFGYGYSWGGFESLALHQEFRETGQRTFMKLAKDEHLVRLHIGLEDPNDLIADIKQALRHLK